MKQFTQDTNKAFYGAAKRLGAHMAVGGGLGYAIGGAPKKDSKNKKSTSRVSGMLAGIELGMLTGGMHGAYHLDKGIASAKKTYSKRKLDAFRKEQEAKNNWDKREEFRKRTYEQHSQNYQKQRDNSWKQQEENDNSWKQHSSYNSLKSLKDLIKEKTGQDFKSKADLKAWHRSKVKEHHPDKHMQKPEPVRKEHESNFKKIQGAIDSIQAHPDYEKMASLKKMKLLSTVHDEVTSPGLNTLPRQGPL